MKGSEEFRNTIEGYLWNLALNDRLFMNKLANEKKSIDGCVNYILNTVMESGINGFADDEIYSMAVHYYEEDSIQEGSPVKDMTVVVNHHVELTKEEIEEIRKEAKERCLAEEMTRLRSLNKPKAAAPAVKDEDALLLSFE